MKWTLTLQTSSMGTHMHLWLKVWGRFQIYLESSIVNSFKGAATNLIIYQITDINVNIYDISLYLEWHFKEKEVGTEISFDIDFEIENKFLNILMSKSFQFGLDKIADAFQRRAEKLFSNSKN